MIEPLSRVECLVLVKPPTQISLKLVGFFRGVFGSFLKDSFLVMKQSVRFFGSFRAVSTPR